MASIVTGIIGGIQGAGAASDAAGDIRTGNAQATGTIQQGVAGANGLIGANADQAIGFVGDAASNGQALVGDATGAAQKGIATAVTGAQGNVQPYITTGQSANTRLSDLADQQFKFSQDDPSYQWRLQQGAKALERSAAARGSLLGGAAAKSMARYSQGLASTEYQNAFNRFDTNRRTSGAMLSDLSGKGLQAGQYSGNVGMQGAEYSGDFGMAGAKTQAGIGMDAAQYGGNAKMRSATEQSNNTITGAKDVANIQMNTGQANAAEHYGRAAAWNGMLSGIGNGVNSILAGGFGGGGGFSPTGAVTGIPQYGGGGYDGGYGGFQLPNPTPTLQLPGSGPDTGYMN